MPAMETDANKAAEMVTVGWRGAEIMTGIAATAFPRVALYVVHEQAQVLFSQFLLIVLESCGKPSRPVGYPAR